MASNSPESLVVGLYDRGAIGYAVDDDPELVGRPGGFVVLRSRRLSPTYVNLRGLTSISRRTTLSGPEQMALRDSAISAYSEVIDREAKSYNHLLGIPHAMTAMGAMIGLRRGESVLSMRTVAKNHGISKMIEGDYDEGQTVLGLDDVVTDGAAKLDAAEDIRDEGLEIDEFVVMVDRQEGGEQTLNAGGIKVYSVLTMGGITAVLKASRRISNQQVNWTGEYYQGLIDSKIIEQMPPELATIV